METAKSDHAQTVRQLLFSHPDMIKCIICFGLLTLASRMADATVVVELKAMIWEEKMSQYTAALQTANSLMAILFGSFFNRCNDKVDRRLAVALTAFLVFLPTWNLLIFGRNSRGLAAYSVAYVASGVTCTSSVGCPVMFALWSDVFPADDRERAFGLGYAGAGLMGLLLGLTGVGLIFAFPADSDTPMLLFIVGMCVVFFLILLTVSRRPPPAASPERRPEDEEPASSGNPELESQEDPGGSTKRLCRGGMKSTTICLLCENKALRKLCVVAGLISLPISALGDVSVQFMFESLGIMGSDHLSLQQLLNVGVNAIALVVTIPAFVLVGVFARRVGPLKALKLLMVPVALAVTAPALLAVVRTLGFVPVVAVLSPMGLLAFPPLQTLVVLVAPPDRIAEAMGIIGASKEFAGVIGNLSVTLSSGYLQRSGLSDPFWVFYPSCGLITLLSLCFLQGLVLPKSGEQPSEDRVRPEFQLAAKTPQLSRSSSLISSWVPASERPNIDMMRSWSLPASMYPDCYSDAALEPPLDPRLKPGTRVDGGAGDPPVLPAARRQGSGLDAA